MPDIYRSITNDEQRFSQHRGTYPSPRLLRCIYPTFRLLNYSERMKTDNFDGSNGFAIDGGIKDASYVAPFRSVWCADNVAVTFAA